MLEVVAAGFGRRFFGKPLSSPKQTWNSLAFGCFTENHPDGGRHRIEVSHVVVKELTLGYY